MKTHHIGYMVQDISKARVAFEKLGFQAQTDDIIYDIDRHCDFLFMENDGSRVELLRPKDDTSPIWGLAKRYKNMPYHICFETDDLDGLLASLTAPVLGGNDPQASHQSASNKPYGEGSVSNQCGNRNSGAARNQYELKHYSFEDIAVGQSESFTAVIGEKEMEMFCEVTGDCNPRHTQKGVSYGLLTTSFLSTLAGMFLPGKFALIQSVEVNFRNALLIEDADGEQVTVIGTVSQKNDAYRTITLKIEIHNTTGDKLVTGKMFVGVSEYE